MALIVAARVTYASGMTPFDSALEQAIADQISAAAARSRPRISQSELAKSAGVGREAMSNYLNGHRAMPLPVAIAATERLGLDFSELIRRAEGQVGR